MAPAQLRCVVVDDDPEFLEQVKRWFVTSCSDFEVMPFTNSVEAIDYLRLKRVDLVFTAYLVPQIDGLQLISIVRSFNAHVPICMFSAVPIQATALARGATAFFSKSAVWSQLGDALARIRGRISSHEVLTGG